MLAGGLIAGTLDIAYAYLFWAIKSGVPLQRILQGVAAGLLGPASIEGGKATAALGLGLHYLIAISMSITYYLVSLRWRLLWQRPVLFGAIYGALLYVIMNYIVVPLSAAGSASGPKDPLWIWLTLAVHILFVGIPIALAARRAREA